MKKRYMYYALSLLFLISSLYAQTEISTQEIVPLECTYTLIARPDRHHDAAHYTPNPNSHEASFTHPHIPVKEGTSQNWSGYATLTNLTHPTAGSVSYVAGTWIVPTLSAASHTTYSSFWVGIDGYASNSVEQLGTEQDWVNGRQQNYAWFEMYPNYSYMINGFPVNAGDTISASVKYEGNGVFLLTMVNNTRRVSVTIPTSYTISHTAQRSSAEWIAEAPYSNGILPLSHFGMAHFSNCVATINGVQGAINYHLDKDDALTMITANGAPKAVPSALSANGQAFTVTWDHE